MGWRGDAAVVWTGRELLIWGGSYGAHGAKLAGDGAAYDPSTDRWRVLPPSPLAPRAASTAVWTGREMVVFGGYTDEHIGTFRVSNDAATYDPATNTWHVIPPPPISRRAYAIGLWTGRRVLVLGGRPAVSSADDRDGAEFDPATNSWRRVAAYEPPRGHIFSWLTAVKVNGLLLGFSDWYAARYLGHGSYTTAGGADVLSYDAARGAWRLIPKRANALAGPEEVIGGASGHVFVRGVPYNCGPCPGPIAPELTDVYDVRHNSWTPIATDPVAGTGGAVSAWVGHGLFSLNAGAASLYDPATARWSRLPNAPLSCAGEPLVWTGRQVLAYCPRFGEPTSLAAGLVFTPRDGPTEAT
jgi:hypothetical protein